MIEQDQVTPAVVLEMDEYRTVTATRTKASRRKKGQQGGELYRIPGSSATPCYGSAAERQAQPFSAGVHTSRHLGSTRRVQAERQERQFDPFFYMALLLPNRRSSSWRRHKKK